jgi:HEPN domain-containing protein
MKKITKKWLDYAKGDLEGAEILLKSAKTQWTYQLSVLHCHQTIEKILKAIIVENGETPIKTHNLVFLLQKTKLEIPVDFKNYIEELNPHYQPARYPDVVYKGPVLKYDEKVARYHLNKTQNLFSWLEKKLISKK